MSRFFGEINQAGYVVTDIEAAMDYWSRVLGVGPWFYMNRVPVSNFYYRGAPSPIEVSVALANSGPLQVELIQQRNDAPSMYRDFLLAGRTGLQHVAYWTNEFDVDVARQSTLGFNIAMSGEVGARGRYVYYDTEFHPGTVIEISEVNGAKGQAFRQIREASKDWDGAEPVRAFPRLDGR